MASLPSPAVKAIPTEYHGARFRSRLEARWAVFFDELGIEWEYEAEGFELKFVGWYLPDFYLPKLDMFVEVKAHQGCDTSKPAMLAGQQKRPIAIVYGPPSFHPVHNKDRVLYYQRGGGKSECRIWFLGRKWHCSDLLRAQFAATGARFEFGECG